MIAEQPAQTVDLPEATAPETPIESTAPAVAAEEMTALENRLSDLESANDDLSAQMVETKESLSDLSASVNALKASIDKLTSNPPVAKAPEKTASPAPKPKQTQATTPAPQPAKQAAPKTQTTNVKWSLKAAQPGKAIIAAQGGNIMNVKTGDVVPGLGKITSIEMKNGLWTVTGTQGSVSQ